MIQKQTVYLPVNTDEPSLIVQEYQREIVVEIVKDCEGYFFTPEQLNEYTANVIKQALDIAAEKAETKTEEVYAGSLGNKEGELFDKIEIIDKSSITNTFEETYKQFKV